VRGWDRAETLQLVTEWPLARFLRMVSTDLECHGITSNVSVVAAPNRRRPGTQSVSAPRPAGAC